jgi:hypothetical protein
MVGSGALIVPSWLAVAWYFPDFRVLATIGVAPALWILYHVRRNTVAQRLAVDATSSPSAVLSRSPPA